MAEFPYKMDRNKMNMVPGFTDFGGMSQYGMNPDFGFIPQAQTPFNPNLDPTQFATSNYSTPTDQFDFSKFGKDSVDPSKFTFGKYIPAFNAGFGALSTLGSLWGAYEQNKLGRQSLALQKEFGNANLNNSIQSYNTALEDKANLRRSSMGWTPEEAQAYVEKNKASR